jgi:hypothetical protein
MFIALRRRPDNLDSHRKPRRRRHIHQRIASHTLSNVCFFIAPLRV